MWSLGLLSMIDLSFLWFLCIQTILVGKEEGAMVCFGICMLWIQEKNMSTDRTKWSEIKEVSVFAPPDSWCPVFATKILSILLADIGILFLSVHLCFHLVSCYIELWWILYELVRRALIIKLNYDANPCGDQLTEGHLSNSDDTYLSLISRSSCWAASQQNSTVAPELGS